MITSSPLIRARIIRGYQSDFVKVSWQLGAIYAHYKVSDQSSLDAAQCADRRYFACLIDDEPLSIGIFGSLWSQWATVYQLSHGHTFFECHASRCHLWLVNSIGSCDIDLAVFSYPILSALMLILRVSDTRSRWRQSAATLTIGAPTRDASRRSISAGGGSSGSYSFELRYFDTSSSSAAWVAIYHDWWLGLFRERTWVFCWCRLRWHRSSSDNIVDSSRWILRFGCVLTFRLVWQPLHRSSESVFTDKLWVCQWCSEAFP